MTKTEFTELVQKNGEFSSKEEAKRAIKAFTDSITEALVKKETVQLVGFATFSTVEVPKKSGRVPNSDRTYTKEGHTAPKIKIGATLKEAVAKG